MQFFAILTDDQSQMDAMRISRRTTNGFNLIPSFISDDIGNEGAAGLILSQGSDRRRDRRLCYTLPIDGAPKLFLKSASEIIVHSCLLFLFVSIFFSENWNSSKDTVHN